MNRKFQSRKFWLTMGLVGLSSAMVFRKRAEFSQWAHFNKAIFAVYVTGNVGEKYIENNFSS